LQAVHTLILELSVTNGPVLKADAPQKSYNRGLNRRRSTIVCWVWVHI